MPLLFVDLGIKRKSACLNSEKRMRLKIGIIIGLLKICNGEEPQNSNKSAPKIHEDHDDHSEFKESVLFIILIK